MIIELPGILDNDTCDEVIQYFESYPELRRTDDAQPRFNDVTMSTDQIHGPLLTRVAALTNRLIIKAAKFYHLEELYLDYQSIAKWDQGQDMVYHADNAKQDKTPLEYCAWRNYSSILYLNDDFKGGETLFKNQQEKTVPVKGTAILFPASFGYTHGVAKVEEGTRYTISSWFTSDAKHCWC